MPIKESCHLREAKRGEEGGKGNTHESYPGPDSAAPTRWHLAPGRWLPPEGACLPAPGQVPGM